MYMENYGKKTVPKKSSVFSNSLKLKEPICPFMEEMKNWDDRVLHSNEKQ